MTIIMNVGSCNEMLKVINFINIIDIVAHLLLAIYLNPPKTMGTCHPLEILEYSCVETTVLVDYSVLAVFPLNRSLPVGSSKSRWSQE